MGGQEEAGCEHNKVLLANLLQPHWAWQGDRQAPRRQGVHKCSTTYMASLDVKKAFDVARPKVIAN